MDKKTFTSYIEGRLQLSGVPEVVQEIVLHDLTLLILKRVYVETVSLLSEENAARYEIAVNDGNFDMVYDLLMGQEHIEEIVLRSTDEILSEFTRQLAESA